MGIKLYTSYFGKSLNHPQAVAITVRPPPFSPKVRHCDQLAPTWKLVSAYKTGEINAEEYKKRYLDMLRRKNDGDPRNVLMYLRDGDVLLCYEKPGEFCHRHVAAEWLKTVEGVEVEELP